MLRMDMVIVTIVEEREIMEDSLSGGEQFVNRYPYTKLDRFAVRKHESPKDGQDIYENSKFHFSACCKKQNEKHKENAEGYLQEKRFILPAFKDQEEDGSKEKKSNEERDRVLRILMNMKFNRPID